MRLNSGDSENIIEAIRLAAEKVRPRGQICLALYAKTRLCRFLEMGKAPIQFRVTNISGLGAPNICGVVLDDSFASHVRRGQWFKLSTYFEKKRYEFLE